MLAAAPEEFAWDSAAPAPLRVSVDWPNIVSSCEALLPD